MIETRCDVLIVGAGLGGVAAAICAAEMGADVILLEESDWIGGQFAAQGVCTPDENRWIETTGGTASYRAFRSEARKHYRRGFNLSASGAAQEFLNVGSCWVSRLSVEPLVARSLLAQSLSALPCLDVRLATRVVEIESRINSISGVVVADLAGRNERILPQFVLDATELGDLLPLAGVEHALGAESRGETGEPDAPESEHPEWIQPFTFPFALELRPRGENHTIAPPTDYDELKRLQRYHVLDGAMKGMFGDLGWWSYRRVIAAENFADDAFPCDVAMINTASNDFRGGVLPVDSETDSAALERARRASLGYVYWLQTECPREDEPAQRGYPELRLRADLFGTPDGIAPQPYIRESRRIRSLRTVLEHEIVAADSDGRICRPGPRAALFPDSVGIGHYWLDIHDGGTTEPSRFLETRPFQIPLGALIPVRVTNLIPACKNIGVTHLTNGAYRLHPIEWNIGESAGALAALCARENVIPRIVREDRGRLRRFQRLLLSRGIPIFWWTDLADSHPAFVSAHLLAAAGIWPDGDSLDFLPDAPLSPESREAVEAGAGRKIPWPAAALNRGDAALWLDGFLDGGGL